MTHKISTDRSTAVAQDYFWQPIATCPISVKVQLLGNGGVAQYGVYHGKDDFWVAWAPLPRIPTSLKK